MLSNQDWELSYMDYHNKLNQHIPLSARLVKGERKRGKMKRGALDQTSSGCSRISAM